MGAKILRSEAHHVGYERDFVIYDEKESEKLLKLVLNALKVVGDLYDVSTLRDIISKVKQSMNEKLIDYYDNEFPMFKTIFMLYIKALRASNAMDFDDLLGLTYKLFRTTPEVLKDWQHRFEYFLVDEYQDTNKAQHEVFKFLVGNSSNVTVVGDPQQCIYTWRGAHPDNILKFESEFPGAEIIKLEQNYRSSKKILGAANVVISKATGLWKKKVLDLWTGNISGEDIILREFYDRAKESAYVASEITKLKTIKGLKWNDFAILVRLTFLTRHIEEALMRLRIPYQIIGGLKFGQRKEIRDLVSYLSLVHNPRDEIAFERIVNVPSRGIGPAAISTIKEQDPESYIDKLRLAIPKLSKKAKAEAEKLLKAFEFVMPKANDFPHDTLAYLYNTLGYEGYLKDKFKGDSFDRISNVKELLALLKTAQLNGRTLSNFLEENKLVSVQDDINEKDSVKVMTIHAAKGLEFPVVFVVGLEEGILPCNMAQTPDELEEERRLFYVAITRPKEQLRLSYAVNEYGGDYGTKRAVSPSRYVNDIKDHVRFI
jgi:DNA helicase-2/ATP-dependent DNA helicase PcrA